MDFMQEKDKGYSDAISKTESSSKMQKRYRIEHTYELVSLYI